MIRKAHPPRLLAVCAVTSTLLMYSCRRSSESGPVSVFVEDRIGWAQRADDAVYLGAYSYILYVDGEPHTLVDVVCDTSPNESPFTCSAELPEMPIGVHQLQLSTRELRGRRRESAKSRALHVIFAGVRDTSASRVRE